MLKHPVRHEKIKKKYSADKITHYQIKHYSQSQRTQPFKLTNQNSKWSQMQVTDAKRENVRERVTIGFGFTSDWMKKSREFFKAVVQRSWRKNNYELLQLL